ncbi:MAG: UbiA prenyltransferase family protein [Pseudonocardiales bacterium]|nr:UbiA prenyltransferase family protein [Pseudonocardiales bacterium]
MSSWRDVVRIHRLEYPFPVHYLSHAVLGACYGASDVQQLFTAPVLLSIIANLLSIVGGNPLNAAVDISTNAHTQDKRDIAHAALRLGRRHAMSWAATEMTVALAAAIVSSLWLDRIFITVGVALTIALCLLYNLEPVRLKRRGLANPITIALTTGPLPSLVSYSAVRPDLTVSTWLIFIGLGALITGRALWWTVPDQIGDKTTGMTTPTVQYGASQAIVMACDSTVVGLSLLGWGLWWRYGPLWALLGVAVNGPFLLSKLALLRRSSDYTLPSSTQIRRRDLSLVMIADILLVFLPLAARGP